MEQLDFENFISSSSNWFSPFDGDGAYLTASRQILETITEETSEDEENNGNWSHYEHEHSIWSSESETGSVIRMEVHNDQDSISERDLACPAKRPRHDDFIIGGIITTVPATAAAPTSSSTTTSLSSAAKMSSAGTLDDLNIRKFQRSDEFFDSGNSFSTSSSNSIFRTKPIRDDFFSDSDSLSYNSLSRSSSLIQFESLERQLLLNEQTAATSSVGNSSPSLLSFEAISTTTTNDRGSSGCLKRYESIDTRLHQTYYDLDKITFDEDNLLFTTRQRTSRSCSKSDSESSDNSILSHEERILRNPVSHPPRSSSLSIPKGGVRNSAENLSEDSGYCDGNGIVVKKSKSLQNFEFVDDEKYKQNSNCNIKIDPKEMMFTKEAMDDKNKPNIEDDYDADTAAASPYRTYLSVSLPEISVRGNRCCARRRQHFQEDNTTTTFCSLPIDLQSSLPVPFSRRLIVDFYRDRDDDEIETSSSEDSDDSDSLHDLTVVAKKKIMSSRRNSDSPSELGKGNFLLDEISEHFNKNLSILNDRENSFDAEEKYKQIINKFIEREGDEVDGGRDDEGEVQHVKLTIRKPPRKEVKSTVEVQTISQHLSKTFDQDPTNLTTSYATSLEKCNFDSKELSQTDLNKILPKRRFRTTQKKRGLVSSTPNLNENINDLDDDDGLCTSSAHASCAQLAPIGILVQTGSKQSVGKEVSFCPVVSKYSWAEQSSEECNDASTSSLEDASPKERTEQEEEFEEEYIHDDKTAFNTQFNEDVMENTMNILPSVKTRQSEPIPILKEQPEEKKKVEHHNFIGSANMFNAIDSREIVNGSTSTTTTEQRKRPTSEFLDNERRISDNVFADVITKNKSNSSENLNSRKKFYSSASTNPNQKNMSSSMTVKTSVVGETVLNNNNGNNNYLMNSKFKVNEKSPNKGFFSRFTNGFRFSLRRKKKDKSKSADNSITSSSSTSTTSTLKSTGNSNNNNHMQSPPSPDFIYIPLKGQQQTQQHHYNQQNHQDNPPTQKRTTTVNNNNQNHVVVTGKPPLPTPPRIVGVSEKVRACGPAPDETLIGTSSFNNNNKYSSILTTSSPAQTPVHCNANFLEHERGYYEFKNQLADKMNGANDNKSGACFRQSPGYSTNFQNKIGLIETNLDTHETKISGKTRSLMELGLEQQQYQKRQLKIHENEVQENGNNGNTSGSKRPHKSMEFLLDKENQKNTLPPENELRKTHENSTALSEHQLRVQASLQRLNIPDWFKQYNPTPKENGGYKPGNFSRKRTQESARWTGLNSKTTSLSSLGSQKSERNLILLSPSAHSHHGQTAHSSHSTTQQTNGGGSQGFGRWSTSHLNSNQISPSTSGRNTFTRGGPANSSFISVGSSIRNSYRTPYLGWRSQEKLAQPRTPHERLASTLLANLPAKLAEQPEYQIDQPPLPSINHPAGSPEIQSSIKEVTSAIVHYVNDQNNRAPRSRSVSPNSRCWLESSFVGLKPVDSPQTPVIETSTSTFSNLNSGNNTNISSSYKNTTLTSKNNESNTSGMNGGVDGESSFII